MTQPLNQRTAIVTGGARGLGLEIARSLTAAGANVLVTGREEAPLAAAADALGVATFAGDVADPDACSSAVATAEERFGPVSVLVNNAGVQGPIGPLDAVDWREWTRTIEVNLFGPVLMTRAVLAGMRARGAGKIINLSGGGATAPRPHFSAYAAAKVAVVRLTETLAEELRGTGIDVNAIAPGAINTRMLDELLAAGPEGAGVEAYAKGLAQRDRGGDGPERAAALVTFLASAASDGISGRLISAIWDDWTRLPEQRDELMRSDTYTLRRVVPGDRR